MSIAARFKWAAFARSAPTSPTRERAPSIWAGSSDLIRLHPRDAGLTGRAGPPLARRDAVECGRPPPGNSRRGGYRSTATSSGCRSPSARTAECRLRRSGMSRVTEQQMNRGSRHRLSPQAPRRRICSVGYPSPPRPAPGDSALDVLGAAGGADGDPRGGRCGDARRMCG
jgi:hypothetical protein